MEDKRIIKKYPNRRLYDTEVSKYITLEDIKNNPKLINMSLIKQSRLSVMPLTKNEFKIILKMGQTKVNGL